MEFYTISVSGRPLVTLQRSRPVAHARSVTEREETPSLLDYVVRVICSFDNDLPEQLALLENCQKRG